MKHVLVPVDDSGPAKAAMKHACETYPDATLTVLYASDPDGSALFTEVTSGHSPSEDRYQERAEAIFAEARAIAESYDRTVETELVLGEPARAIVEFVEESDVDHVVIGSHGRTGMSRVLLGSVAEQVARRSPVSVTIVR